MSSADNDKELPPQNKAALAAAVGRMVDAAEIIYDKLEIIKPYGTRTRNGETHDIKDRYDMTIQKHLDRLKGTIETVQDALQDSDADLRIKHGSDGFELYFDAKEAAQFVTMIMSGKNTPDMTKDKTELNSATDALRNNYKVSGGSCRTLGAGYKGGDPGCVDCAEGYRREGDVCILVNKTDTDTPTETDPDTPTETDPDTPTDTDSQWPWWMWLLVVGGPILFLLIVAAVMWRQHKLKQTTS